MPKLALKPIVLLLSLDNQPSFDEMYAKFIDELFESARIKRASNCNAAVRYLSNNFPQAVIVTDPGITAEANQEAVNKLKLYIVKGGIAVFGCNFGSFITAEAMNAFWSSQFKFPWEMGDCLSTRVSLNFQASLVGTRSMAGWYDQKAVFLKNVNFHNSLYLLSEIARKAPNSGLYSALPADMKQTPVAWTAFGMGWIGYIGDVDAGEEASNLIFSMCGISMTEALEKKLGYKIVNKEAAKRDPSIIPAGWKEANEGVPFCVIDHPDGSGRKVEVLKL